MKLDERVIGKMRDPAIDSTSSPPRCGSIAGTGQTSRNRHTSDQRIRHLDLGRTRSLRISTARSRFRALECKMHWLICSSQSGRVLIRCIEASMCFLAICTSVRVRYCTQVLRYHVVYYWSQAALCLVHLFLSLTDLHNLFSTRIVVR